MMFTLLLILTVFLGVVGIPSVLLVRMAKGKKKQRYMADVLDAGEISFGYKEMPDDPRLKEHTQIFELEDVLINRLVRGNAIDEQMEEAKLALKPGAMVKLVFDIFVEEEFGTWKETVVAEEALWVFIEACEYPLFLGILATEPQELETTLRPGHKLWFHGNHILEID